MAASLLGIARGSLREFGLVRRLGGFQPRLGVVQRLLLLFVDVRLLLCVFGGLLRGGVGRGLVELGLLARRLGVAPELLVRGLLVFLGLLARRLLIALRLTLGRFVFALLLVVGVLLLLVRL